MVPAFFGSLKQEFTGYNSKKLLADMMAGLTVCAVALPLALTSGRDFTPDGAGRAIRTNQVHFDGSENNPSSGHCGRM